MNLFLRIFLVWVKSLFRPKIGLLEEAETFFRVWLTDQDAFRHMTNSRYFSLTDVCIIDYMLRTGAWAKLSRKGWLPFVVYEDMIIEKTLTFPERFSVRTKLLGWNETHVVIRHIFQRADGTVTAEGFTLARFVGKKRQRPTPADVLAMLGQPLSSPTLPVVAQAALDRALAGYQLDAKNA